MATISNLPTVTRIQVPLGRKEFDEREFYALPSFMLFIEQILPAAAPGVIAARETPRKQIDSVWEMKSVDLRIFGWMHKPRCFVAVFGGLADDYKSQNGDAPRESYEEA